MFGREEIERKSILDSDFNFLCMIQSCWMQALRILVTAHGVWYLLITTEQSKIPVSWIVNREWHNTWTLPLIHITTNENQPCRVRQVQGHVIFPHLTLNLPNTLPRNRWWDIFQVSRLTFMCIYHIMGYVGNHHNLIIPVLVKNKKIWLVEPELYWQWW